MNIIKANLTIPPIRAGQVTPDRGYFAAARYFFLGVEVLSKGSPDLSPACAFLAAQSLECVLKAYLSKAGVPEAQLKQISHNLEVLWADASSRGLNVSAKPPEWCVILNQTHDKPYHLRYPTRINAFQTPAYAPMVSELKQLLDLVQAAV